MAHRARSAVPALGLLLLVLVLALAPVIAADADDDRAVAAAMARFVARIHQLSRPNATALPRARAPRAGSAGAAWPAAATASGTAARCRLQQRSERVYAGYRNATRRLLGAAPALPLFAPGRQLWDVFPPTAHCPDVERVGRVGDGGKFVCGFGRLRDDRDCVVYSFGVDSETTFEQAVLARTRWCRVYAFDHTVERFFQAELLTPEQRARVTFLRYGLGATDRPDGLPLLTLDGALRRLNHSRLSILKVDVEAAEWAVIQKLLVTHERLPADQLLIELHVSEGSSPQTLQGVATAFAHLHAMGMRQFMSELNVWGCKVYRKPVLSEFSFIRADRLPCAYDAAVAEANYQRAVAARTAYLQTEAGQALVAHADAKVYKVAKTAWVTAWDFIYPVYSCPTAEDFAPLGAPLHHLCYPSALTRRHCVAYHFAGPGAPYSDFPLRLARRTRCVVYVLGGADWPALQREPRVLPLPDLRPESLGDAMVALGHARVDVVRFDRLVDADVPRVLGGGGGGAARAGQVLAQLWLTTPRALLGAQRWLEAAGYRPFMLRVDTERCFLPTGSGSPTASVSWVHRSFPPARLP